MTQDKELIINGINVIDCFFLIHPKKQCPMKSMPYAKEASCIGCKENNTRLNFCKNNPNCYYKQNKKNEHQLNLVNQDNDALSRYCEILEKKIAQLANMQDKKVILE